MRQALEAARVIQNRDKGLGFCLREHACSGLLLAPWAVQELHGGGLDN